MASAFFSSALAWLMKAERRGSDFEPLAAKGWLAHKDGTPGQIMDPPPALSTPCQSRNLRAFEGRKMTGKVTLVAYQTR